MKLTDIIKKRDNIQEGKFDLFLAEKDFLYKGFPVLKNSLILNSGNDEISVNMIGFGVFQETNIPELISDKLRENDDFDYIVDKCSNCEFEVVKLNFAWRGIWHDNHFDKWTGSFSNFKERIIQSRILEYSGIAFSSLMYKFNAINGSLDYFINLKPIKLEIGDKVIELPELLEISRNKSSFDIIPLNKKVKYHDVFLKSALLLSNNGILSGENAEEFDAKIINHSEIKTLTITEGFKLNISSSGEIEIDIFNEKSYKIEKFKIKKI